MSVCACVRAVVVVVWMVTETAAALVLNFMKCVTDVSVCVCLYAWVKVC